MAEVQARLVEVRRIYLEMLRLAATLSTPWQIGAFVLADLGISVLFGEQWLGAVPVFRAYLAFRLIQALLAITDSTISALGRPQVRFAVDLAQLPFFVAGLWFGLRVWGGIEGVAWSLTVVRTAAGLVYLALSLRLTKLAAGALLRALLPSSLAAALMGLLVYGLRYTTVVRAWSAAGYPLAVLVFLILVGVLSYFVLLYGLDRSGFREVRDMAWRIVVPEAARRRLAGRFGPGGGRLGYGEEGGDGRER
jgi:O-antigen/teichoic acid export membrane protein